MGKGQEETKSLPRRKLSEAMGLVPPTEGPTHFKNNLGGNFLAKRTLAQAVHGRFFPQTLVPEGLNLPPYLFCFDYWAFMVRVTVR